MTASVSRHAHYAGLGAELNLARGPLRHSLRDVVPNPRYYLDDEEFAEAHRRGELLVAAMLRAFVEMWAQRLAALMHDRPHVDRSRAIDYAPPVDVMFRDYLSALLTADREIRPADTRYQLRASVWDYAQPRQEPHGDAQAPPRHGRVQVGHHGSLNATPKGLWAMFKKKPGIKH